MLLDGKALALEIQDKIRCQIAARKGRPPCLAVVLVGENPASKVYVRNKNRACESVGIRSVSHDLPESTTEEELLDLIHRLNLSDEVDGILVQLPLPSHINESRVIEALDPQKDVDGFHPLNVGKTLIGDPSGFVPCTPLGVKVMLQHYKIPLSGKHVVVVGRSNIVGKPMAALLMQRGVDATVTVCHRHSEDLKSLCLQADVVITAVGLPNLLTADGIRPGTTVVDVGINRIPDSRRKSGYRLVGDVDFEAMKDKCSAITPVPGGVGPMTVTMLLNNTFLSYCRREAIHQEDLSAHRLVAELKP